MAGKRANGEGSIFPYKGQYAGYVWVTTPEGQKTRKWCYGKDREETYDKWLKLHAEANRGPVSTRVPTLGSYLPYWLEEVIRPNREPTTYVAYEPLVRLYIVPYLGKKKLDKLQVRDVQAWLNMLPTLCRCCAQGKDVNRPEAMKCCSAGRCCEQFPARGTIKAIRRVLRAAVGYAMREEMIAKNVVTLTTLPSAGKSKGNRGRRKRRNSAWSIDEARQFLEHLRDRNDPLYAAYVLILVLGLRKGEVLGLVDDAIDFEEEEIWIEHQLQRVGGELLHRDITKTEESEDSLPLIGPCISALRQRERIREHDRKKAGKKWVNSDLVFTTRSGTPIEPRNFNRAFAAHCKRAGVPVIRVHDTRHTCASLLAALGIHPSVAKRILRHNLISTTMDVYTQAASPETRAGLQQLSDSLDLGEDDGKRTDQ